MASQLGPGRGTDALMQKPLAAAPEVTLTELARAISRRSGELRFATERDLQAGVAALLAAEGFTAEPQPRLSPLERPDFLVDGVAVELKVKGGAAELERQVARYLGHDQVGGVLVITNRARHRGLPGQINGKPVWVMWIPGAF
jgi:hypothetical protein